MASASEWYGQLVEHCGRDRRGRRGRDRGARGYPFPQHDWLRRGQWIQDGVRCFLRPSGDQGDGLVEVAEQRVERLYGEVGIAYGLFDVVQAFFCEAAL